jgi:ATP-binding cassette, subfamily B, bacterial
VRISLGQYWRLLATYLKPQGRRTALLGLLLLASIALQLGAPQILRQFIDRALAGEPVSTLFWFAGLFLAVALLTQAINLGEVWLAENVGWTATNNLRGDLALHVLRLDASFHNATTPGALIERVDGDVAKLGNFFSRFTVYVLGNALLGAGVIVLLFQIDWRVGGALALFAALAIVIINALRDVAVPFWVAERESSARLFGFIEERLSGTEDIRAAGAVDYVMRSNHEHARDLLGKRQRAAVLGSATGTTSILMFAIGTAIALGLGAWLYRAGDITLGTVFLIYQYATLLSRPIEQITRQMQDLQQAGASIGRVQELLTTQSAIADGPGMQTPNGGNALAVAFDRVTFGYQLDESVVRDVSFTLAPGEILGLVGRTGSGKTTLTRLLFRLHDPMAGAIRLGNIDLRDYRLADLREQIGIVTQDIQLFHATVRDNLTLFDPAIDDARILATLGELGLETWLQSLPDGLDSSLASGGSGLSAGEAQLLAFARVFLHDPRVVVLDEASSRLDPATERRLEYAIDRLLAGRTGIVIAHRLATVRRADTILVMEDGRIAEYGPRAMLAADPSSRFARMLRTGHDQLLGEEEVTEARQ